MAQRGIEILSAKKVNSLKKRGFYADGGNLYLQITKGGSKYWVFRFKQSGRARDMGLGSVNTVSLAQARERARSARLLLVDDVDPIEHRTRQRQAERAQKAKAITFRQVAEGYLELHLDSFKNAKHRAQWRSTLETYVHPKIGHMTVADIGPADVLRVIEPVWKTKAETASRVLQRVGRILDYATTREFRSGDNPAAHVTESLPKRANGKGHHAALPYAELSAFMSELRTRSSLAARALEFTILTAVRTSETIGATRDEIDFEAKVWTIPAERMKAGKAHRVPLCDRALEILASLHRHGERIFPLVDNAMLKLLRVMRPGITTHGMRSSFRDWAAETTNFPNHVVEQALAHAIGDKVEAAYRRGDLFTKRTKLMQSWSDYCAKPARAGNVVSIVRNSASNPAVG